MEKIFRSYWNDKNAIFKLNDFIICKGCYIVQWSCEQINSSLSTFFFGKPWLQCICVPDNDIIYPPTETHFHIGAYQYIC